MIERPGAAFAGELELLSTMSDNAVDRELTDLIAAHRDVLRAPDLVMAPDRLGAARLTRYSFSRSVLRRAHSRGWVASCVHLDLDAEGQGEVAYRVDAEGYVFHFVAFLQALEEHEHTDRVVAERWEIAAALIEGELTIDQWERLRRNVPEQERGRLGPDVLALTRGNRSVRFFEYLVSELAAGRQPDPQTCWRRRDTSCGALRSMRTASSGMRSFHGYEADHPLAAPLSSPVLGRVVLPRVELRRG